MTRINFTPPEFKETAYNCPHCEAYAHQVWEPFYRNNIVVGHISTCSQCMEYSIWHSQKMIYPNFSGIISPNQDLCEDILRDYYEAANIVQTSPRGAAALLRLVIQKLCKQLGESGKNIDSDIANLVKKGLSVKIQQCLDSIRVIGNEAVHPGELDLRDDVETATQLFNLINLIAETMITEPKRIEEIYNKIPNSKKQAIKSRDAAAKN